MRIARIIKVVILLVTLVSLHTAQAQEQSILVDGRDTIRYVYTPAPNNIIPQKDKRFKINFAGTPIYTPSIGLGVTLMATGSYTSKSATSPSSISLYGSATLKGVYNVGIKGLNIFNDKHRLEYQLSIASVPTNFWGVGYIAATTNTPIRYTSKNEHIDIAYYYRLWRDISIGSQIGFSHIYTKASDIEAVTQLTNTPSEILATDISLILEYDSRNNRLNPSRGAFASVSATMRPKVFGTLTKNSWCGDVKIAYYQRLWRGATLAPEIFAQSNSSSTPWQLFTHISSQGRMRGYYEGQFIDRNMIWAQCELRQHIWKGIGINLWGGAANGFDSPKSFTWDHTLPNYGIGAQWQFSNKALLRLDYGFGRRLSNRIINGLTIEISGTL